jgi:hypothetical protein
MNENSFNYGNFNFKEIKEKQNKSFYEKTGEKNKEKIEKLIMNYDWNYSSLEVLKNFSKTVDLEYHLLKYLLIREEKINELIDIFCTENK